MSSDTVHNLKISLFVCWCVCSSWVSLPTQMQAHESRRLACRSWLHRQHRSRALAHSVCPLNLRWVRGEYRQTGELQTSVSVGLSCPESVLTPVILKVRIPSRKQNASSNLITFRALCACTRIMRGSSFPRLDCTYQAEKGGGLTFQNNVL